MSIFVSEFDKMVIKKNKTQIVSIECIIIFRPIKGEKTLNFCIVWVTPGPCLFSIRQLRPMKLINNVFFCIIAIVDGSFRI